MAFFNKQEDVLDIKLTQYGKVMLQKGKFRPHHYCFFDDEVLYDSKYQFQEGEVPDLHQDEAQKDIVDRIKTTPSMKTQHIYYGAESSINDRNQEYDFGRSYYDPKFNEIRIKTRNTFYEDFDIEPNISEHNKSLGYKVYSGPIGLKTVPSLNLKTNSEYFTPQAITYLTQSHSGLPIPQISASIVTTIKQLDAPVPSGDEQALLRYRNQFVKQNLFSQDIRLYDRVLKISSPSLYLEIDEKNSFYKEENYDLEIFYVRERTLEEGFPPRLHIRVDQSSMPANGQYMVLTGSDLATKAAFQITDDVTKVAGESLGDFEGDPLVPILAVPISDNARELVQNFEQALENAHKPPNMPHNINEFFDFIAAPEINPQPILNVLAKRAVATAETIFRFNLNGVSFASGFGRLNTDDPSNPYYLLSGLRMPVVSEYLVPLRFKREYEKQDRWTVEHNFQVKKDNFIPETYPRYFSNSTKLSIFAKSKDVIERPKSNIQDMYLRDLFDQELEDCEE